MEAPDVKAKPPITTPLHISSHSSGPSFNWLSKSWRDNHSVFQFSGVHSQDSDGFCLSLLTFSFIAYQKPAIDFPQLSVYDKVASAGTTVSVLVLETCRSGGPALKIFFPCIGVSPDLCEP